MLLECVAASGPFAFLYHHFGYPRLLAGLAARRRPVERHAPLAELPSVTLIVPAHNEAAVIAAKISNLSALDYPQGKLRVVVVCDGCTDATATLAHQTIRDLRAELKIEVVVQPVNVGKVETLNRAIAAATSDVVALSDASACLPSDALLLAATEFSDPCVGVVAPSYRLQAAGSEGEALYWRQQTKLKADEAAVAAPLGAHGAFYLFRRHLWQELPADTINDDFILPMSIVASGYRAVYRPDIVTSELETTSRALEFRRRVRIGAGNLQQVLRLWTLADLARPDLAFVFLSGKALRVFVPFLLALSALAISVLALQGSAFFTLVWAAGAALVVLALYALAHREETSSRMLKLLAYLVEGHAASALGATRYALGLESKPWRRAAIVSGDAQQAVENDYVPVFVSVSKRIFDIVCSLLVLPVLVVLFVPIALAIKLNSKGPIFYTQVRVGRATQLGRTYFRLIKFRTMRSDAEAASGAVWASKNDPRITRVGNFLRKTRLDELPQCINVLRGEMSIIGPRPERPEFFDKLGDAIPFYDERVWGLRPGITGFAQVNQAYDQSIEDVKNKLLFDHAYSAQLSSWRDWARMDLEILFKTATVMLLAKGQ